ncbi:hypothetical protein ACP3TC_18030 [Winslowiella sp. 2C04]|uniref:hypothetical protein n=1 Tax=Winslowiella sp. 2C04 TaxID=3416179 RepID=UPI003CEB3347
MLQWLHLKNHIQYNGNLLYQLPEFGDAGNPFFRSVPLLAEYRTGSSQKTLY